MNDEFGNFIRHNCNLSKFWWVSRLKLVLTNLVLNIFITYFYYTKVFQTLHIAYYEHYEPSNAFIMKVDKDSTSFLCIIVENMQQ
jgi:hypothetical protein